MGKIKGILTSLIILIGSYCNALDLNIKYGLGFGMPSQNNVSESKLISLELQDSLGILKHKIAFGRWFDDNISLNRSSASFGSYSIGIRVEPGYFYAENYLGVAFISQTDGLLSTNFEFTEEVGFGVRDLEGRFIGFAWKHFSNAGIQLPNKGRDFILMNTGLAL